MERERRTEGERGREREREKEGWQRIGMRGVKMGHDMFTNIRHSVHCKIALIKTTRKSAMTVHCAVQYRYSILQHAALHITAISCIVKQCASLSVLYIAS